ncbi:hypothetical protein WR25_19982 isoform A [Diploscapter pachys]|uniref:Uncharacterized protein n=1 Tax=Diploscapter pachys TaxID=2018661 RepID=A0A2A2KVC0_9BILA|nr:hypothetical protein WR25_19982 isoform A [Diploscapter pachys]
MSFPAKLTSFTGQTLNKQGKLAAQAKTRLSDEKVYEAVAESIQEAHESNSIVQSLARLRDVCSEQQLFHAVNLVFAKADAMSLHVQMNARILQFFKPYVSTLGVEMAIRWFETLHEQIVKGEAHLDNTVGLLNFVFETVPSLSPAFTRFRTTFRQLIPQLIAFLVQRNSLQNALLLCQNTELYMEATALYLDEPDDGCSSGWIPVLISQGSQSVNSIDTRQSEGVQFLKRIVDFATSSKKETDQKDKSKLNAALHNWNTLTKLAQFGLAERVIERINPKAMLNLLTELPEDIKTGIVDAHWSLRTATLFLSITPQLKSESETVLKEVLLPIAFDPDLSNEWSGVELISAALKTFSDTKHLKSVVNLAFVVGNRMVSNILDEMKLDEPTHFSRREDRIGEKLLILQGLILQLMQNGGRHVHNDQTVNLFELIKKHFQMVQKASKRKQIEGREADKLTYGCTRIADQLAHHEIHYSRLIPLLIAETIYEGAYISSALTALHQQCDKHGRAYLATNLPANQRVAYSRMFPKLKETEAKVF